MRVTHLIAVATASITLTNAQSFISAVALSPASVSRALISLYPNPSIALLPQPFWWWQSGSVIDSLLNYYHTTNDASYNALLSNTLISQVTSTNDFMTPDATGNDDQAWWGLAAMSAAEFGLPPAQGAAPWIDYARNVFNTQKARWNTERCNGGLKWKINTAENGYNYRSTISNALFFQLAARIARFSNDGDARAWAEKAYDWTKGVGLIDNEFNVFDGTDDAKGSGCVDVNRNKWSYNTGALLYGAAVMADVTQEARWSDRTKGLFSAARRNFVRDGRLFEQICEGDGSCNTDQVSFKGTLARWLGGTATLRSELREEIVEVLGSASDNLGWSQGSGLMDQFTTLEVADGLIAAGGGVAGLGKQQLPSRLARLMR